MKILHTSDWHLGQKFMGKSREDEHLAFLDWIIDTINEEKIDVLIIAGDIFDTGTPPNYALEMYYNFLKNLNASSCKNIVIIGGNHDSVATLRTSSKLLKVLNIDVIASGDTDEENIIKIYKESELRGIICAVPFLRDTIVRKSLGGQSSQDKEKALNDGITSYYTSIYDDAKEIRGGNSVPIVATGHLTTVGSKTSESEREIYIGNTLNISSGFLGNMFDYVALGHLHLSQKVGCEHVRYSGSPIPLSFSEATSQKKVNIVTFDNQIAEIVELDIPLFRPLRVIKGNGSSVINELSGVENKNTWIEIHLKDDNPQATIQLIHELCRELDLTILAIKTDRSVEILTINDIEVSSLDEIKPIEVFEKRMEMSVIEDDAMKSNLISRFKDIINEVELV